MLKFETFLHYLKSVGYDELELELIGSPGHHHYYNPGLYQFRMYNESGYIEFLSENDIIIKINYISRGNIKNFSIEEILSIIRDKKLETLCW